MVSESASYAAYMLANNVSPPTDGHRAQVQDARHRRFFVSAHVGVPGRAFGEGRGRVGMDLHQFRAIVDAWCRGVDVELAETAAERHVLVVRDVLVAKKEHEVPEQPVVQLAESLVVKRLTQVDAMHFRADIAGERPELDYVVAHFPLAP